MVLPTNAPYETRFSKTTTYYWSNFDVNATENANMGYDEKQQGPFGFGNGVGLNKTQVCFLTAVESFQNNLID